MQRTAIVVNGYALYVNANTGNGKLGSKGKATAIPVLYKALGKGKARNVRKQLRKCGLVTLAAL